MIIRSLARKLLSCMKVLYNRKVWADLWYCFGFDIIFGDAYSLLHLMRAITRAHASTLASMLMRVKNSTRHFCLWRLLSGTLEWRKWKKDKTLNEMIIVNTIISLAYITRSLVSLLEPRQNNLSNPDAYSELCQTSKMEFFAKIVSE